MLAIKLAIDALDPRLWYMACGAIVWLLMYAVRRFAPGIWAAAVARNAAIPQLWMAVIGALLALHPALGLSLFKAVQEVLVTAMLSTIGANGLHALLRGLPGRYNGAAVRVAAAMATRCNELPARAPSAPTPVVVKLPTPPSGR